MSSGDLLLGGILGAMFFSSHSTKYVNQQPFNDSIIWEVKEEPKKIWEIIFKKYKELGIDIEEDRLRTDNDAIYYSDWNNPNEIAHLRTFKIGEKKYMELTIFGDEGKKEIFNENILRLLWATKDIIVIKKNKKGENK